MGVGLEAGLEVGQGRRRGWRRDWRWGRRWGWRRGLVCGVRSWLNQSLRTMKKTTSSWNLWLTGEPLLHRWLTGFKPAAAGCRFDSELSYTNQIKEAKVPEGEPDQSSVLERDLWNSLSPQHLTSCGCFTIKAERQTFLRRQTAELWPSGCWWMVVPVRVKGHVCAHEVAHA